MSQYIAKQIVNAPAEEVFAYVTDIPRMVEYLPTTHETRPQGEGRVWIKGEAGGHAYESDGWFEVDRDAYTMRWGSDGENMYSGNLQIQDRGADSYVTVTLNFEPKPDVAEAFERQMGSRHAAIQDGLEKALLSIKNQCEGTGGRVPTAAEMNHGYVS